MGKCAALAEHGLESRNTGSAGARFDQVPGKTGLSGMVLSVPRQTHFLPQCRFSFLGAASDCGRKGECAALAEYGRESRNTGSVKARFDQVPRKTVLLGLGFLLSRGKRPYRCNADPIPWAQLRFASERGVRGTCRTWTRLLKNGFFEIPSRQIGDTVL